MERAVEGFAAVCLLGVGLSHLAQPVAWAEFFARLRALGRPGVFADGLLTLSFGAVLVAFHNVWAWPAVAVTALGWAMVLKAVVRLAAPGLGLRAYERITPGRAWRFRAGGLLALAFGALCGYLALWA